MNAQSLIVPGSEKQRLSWSQFATLVANTDGSHLGVEYHDLLAESDLFGAIGMSLQDYLLRQIGWQVEMVLAHTLAASGRSIPPRTRRLDFLPRTPIWMEFRYTPGKGMRAAVSVSVTSDEVSDVEVMRFYWRGRVHHLFHHGGSANEQIRVTMVIDDPESGHSDTFDAVRGPIPPDF
ncbi:hypothetical protein GCM10027414_36910 [Humibacter ginsengiterrae]